VDEIIRLKNGIEIVGVDEIPDEYKIFNQHHFNYVSVLVANILLNDVKGQLLNIIEGIGLPERQERAIKRSVTNVLHDTVHHFEESMELVREDNKDQEDKNERSIKINNINIPKVADATGIAKNLKKLARN
jgi:hypothetical protein